MDKIYIHGLKLQTIIGIYDWERAKKQPLIIDIDIGTSFTQAIQSDDIRDCINYADVAEKISLFADSHSFQLVETFTEQIAQFILSEYQAQWVKIKLNKPQAIKNAESTGIVIERSRYPK